MSTATKDFRNQGQKLANEAQSTATNLTDRAKDATASLADKAKDATANLADKAKNATSYIADKADAATEAVGERMENVGHAIRDYAPQSGVLGTAGDALAGKLEGGGRYLEERGMSGIGEDLTALIRNNPVPALLVGIGVGFCLARLLRS